MKFTDNAGREWLIRIDVNALRRVRDALDANFGNWVDINPLLQRLRMDDVFVAEVAYWILQPEIAKREDATQESFYAEMHNEAIEKACAAIEDGLAAFFRHAAIKAAVATEVQRLRKILPTHGESSTSSQESSQSTLDDSRLES